MKTFIYLPLIALVILTGCKSNSFNTQRYTKYSHASHKTVKHEKEIVKANKTMEEKVETEIVRPSSTPVTLIASGISTIKDAVIKPERKVYDLNASEGSEFFSNNETLSNNNSSQISTQKVSKHNKYQKRGLIGSAFETALYIVLVVIFILLIIFLLSVIF